jgi:hypothetical protein
MVTVGGWPLQARRPATLSTHSATLNVMSVEPFEAADECRSAPSAARPVTRPTGRIALAQDPGGPPIMIDQPDNPESEVFDPYDPATLRAMPPSVAVTDGVILGVTVRKPKKDEFFRVWDSAEHTVDAFVLEYEGGNSRKEDYFVPAIAEVRAMCEQVSAGALKPVRVFTCMSKFGSMFLWAARLPDERQQKWYVTALNGADEAKSNWCRLEADMRAGMYNLQKAVADYGEPEWPDVKLRELLSLAFDTEHTILSVGHPVLQALRGEL